MYKFIHHVKVNVANDNRLDILLKTVIKSWIYIVVKTIGQSLSLAIQYTWVFM